MNSRPRSLLLFKQAGGVGLEHELDFVSPNSIGGTDTSVEGRKRFELWFLFPGNREIFRFALQRWFLPGISREERA